MRAGCSNMGPTEARSRTRSSATHMTLSGGGSGGELRPPPAGNGRPRHAEDAAADRLGRRDPRRQGWRPPARRRGRRLPLRPEGPRPAEGRRRATTVVSGGGGRDRLTAAPGPTSSSAGRAARTSRRPTPATRSPPPASSFAASSRAFRQPLERPLVPAAFGARDPHPVARRVADAHVVGEVAGRTREQRRCRAEPRLDLLHGLDGDERHRADDLRLDDRAPVAEHDSAVQGALGGVAEGRGEARARTLGLGVDGGDRVDVDARAPLRAPRRTPPPPDRRC